MARAADSQLFRILSVHEWIQTGALTEQVAPEAHMAVFGNLAKIQRTLGKLRGRGRLTEQDVKAYRKFAWLF